MTVENRNRVEKLLVERVTSECRLAEEALTSLGGRLIEAQDQERIRIARELHDDIGQRLALLAIEVQQMYFDSPAPMRERSEELFQHIADISSDVLALSHRLHSPKLEYLGIVAAMKGFCEEFAAQQKKMTVDFESGGVPADLPQAVSVCLFRVLQEALPNAATHSGVQHVQVRLQGTSTAVLLTIRDRGRGFDAELAMHGRGVGLISMRERVMLVNGTLVVTSKPAFGTEIRVRVPIAEGIRNGRKKPRMVSALMNVRAGRR